MSEWAGGLRDVRFGEKYDSHDNQRVPSPTDQDSVTDNDDEDEDFSCKLFSLEDTAPDPSLVSKITFVLKDGQHLVSVWCSLYLDAHLFVEVPKGDLPPGSKECFVSLLEYAEEVLGASTVYLCISKQREDRAHLMRTFLFLGFEVVHPSFSPTLPESDHFVYMGYSLE